MAITPADDCTKNIVKKILKPFVVDGVDMTDRQTEIAMRSYCSFEYYHLEGTRFKKMFDKYPDFQLTLQQNYVYLQLTEDNSMLPIVTFESEDDWTQLRIYVLLATIDGDDQFHSFGLRFETDESGAASQHGKHDFCHAQLCNYMTAGVQNIAATWVPESQPSIPLDACDQIGLVLCTLVSIYGRRFVQRTLIEERDDEIDREMRKLRSLAAT